MHAKRLYSFTLVELTVTLFISAFLIGVAYFLVQSLGQYFRILDNNKVEIAEMQMLRTKLREDLEEADSVLVKQDERFVFYANRDSLMWQAHNDSVLCWNGTYKHVFPIKACQIRAESINSKGWVSGLQLDIPNRNNSPMMFGKEYPIINLLK
jgi:type II secretory pathway component PulJ